jgi:sulfite reductase alpha subunit-like flavoprotein
MILIYNDQLFNLQFVPLSGRSGIFDRYLSLPPQDSGRHCMHIELDIEGSRLRYDAGDHVAIYPTNNLVRGTTAT